VLTLGVERVGGDHPPGKVQPVQQGPEPGDLVGGVVDVGLAQDRAGGVVHRRQQVHLPVAVVAAAAQGLAVDCDCSPRRAGRRLWARRWWWLGGQPGAGGAVEGVGVDAGQHAAHGRLAGWPPGAGQQVTAHPERGQHLAGRIVGHSPIAARDLAPASTAAAATASTAPSGCRRPRRWRGSTIWAR
jgi:hypothetical protein